MAPLDLGLRVPARRADCTFTLDDDDSGFVLVVRSDHRALRIFTIAKESGEQPVLDAQREIVGNAVVRDSWQVQLDPEPFVHEAATV